MKMVLLGGALILSPAVAVIVYFWGSALMFPAVASLFVASLPFFAFAYVIRSAAGAGDDAHGH